MFILNIFFVVSGFDCVWMQVTLSLNAKIYIKLSIFINKSEKYSFDFVVNL